MMMTTTKTVKQEEDYVPYPTRYCMYAIPLDIQQLQQQQQREKVKVSWYYYHSYGPIGRHIIHRVQHTILIVTSSRMDVTLSSFHPVIPTNTAPLYRTTTIFYRSDTTTSTLHLLHSTPYCTCREDGSSWGWLVGGWGGNGNGVLRVVKQQRHHH